jgi:putative Mn2+ efflux pump MntP
MMPVAGWFAGTYLAGMIDAWDHWVAFGLLSIIGLKMILESRGEAKQDSSEDPTRGWKLVSLSLATSIDAFAAGLGMAFMGVSVLFPAAIIGVITAVLATAGICFGNRIGPYFGKKAVLAGGIILILIGVKIVIWG